MCNRLVYLAEDLSLAELLDEARNRLSLGMVLWPNVSEHISRLRRIGRWLSDLEIWRAIDSGRIYESYRLKDHVRDCWVLTIIGLDSEAELLGAVAHLPMQRAEVLQIAEVICFDPEFKLAEWEGKGLW